MSELIQTILIIFGLVVVVWLVVWLVVCFVCFVHFTPCFIAQGHTAVRVRVRVGVCRCAGCLCVQVCVRVQVSFGDACVHGACVRACVCACVCVTSMSHVA